MARRFERAYQSVAGMLVGDSNLVQRLIPKDCYSALRRLQEPNHVFDQH